jgi:hypothetical protein
MRRRVPGCGVVVCAVVLAVVTVVARGDMVVPWQAAGSYEGDVITVEGDVARARLEADTVVIEFSTDDPNAFRAILLIPLITDLPRQPQRLYEGKRVRVSGRIRIWHGQPEMILRSPDEILVVGVSTTAPPAPPPPVETTPTTVPRRRALPPTTLAPPPPAPPPPPPPPSVAPEASVPPPTLPTTPTTTPPPPVRPVPVAPPPPTTSTTTPEQEEQAPRLPRATDPCDAAHERWRRAAAAAESRQAELTECLRGGSYRCRSVAAAVAPALSELEWAEQQVEAACP